jgi:predicted DNA-binding transcriptional regulator AlpA
VKQQTSSQPDELLTRDEVAAWLKLPPKSVYELPIAKVKLGHRTVRWRRSDVEEFIDRRTVD